MSPPLEQAQTGIFSKRPRPGRVKTRLCPPLTPEQAADLAQAMLDDLVAVLAGADQQQVGLYAACREDVPWFRERYPGLGWLDAQQEGSLAQRLEQVFSAPWGRTKSRVLVGGDCPLLEPATTKRAHEVLQQGGIDLVFVPDLGGGYSLVGMNRPVAGLFKDVPTSTRDNLERTVQEAEGRGLRVELLEACADVDTPADLERLVQHLADAGVQSLPATRGCLERLELLGV